MRVKAGKWLDAIKVREKSFSDGKGWWQNADEAVGLYNNGKDDNNTVPYNILYSNTEVLQPSLYSAVPKPDVRTRFSGMVLKPIPEVIERFLTIVADPATVGGDSFDLAMTEATLQAVTGGVGIVRLRYYKDRAFPLTFEAVNYRAFIWAKAARWSKVRWLAFVHKMHKDEMFEKFEIEEVDKIGFVVSENCADEERENAVVYEFWDKETRKVYYLSENWQEKLLDEADDPMGLEHFFPVPGLLQMTPKTGKMEPTTLYSYYKCQAEELNRVSVRLNKILEAIKVRGLYNGLLGDDLKNLLEGEDKENKMMAAGEAALLAQSGGIERHIWMLPIDKLIGVAQQLYQARESIKGVIYEITGISDIIRGSSVASETATAQDLKNKWGTVRLRKMQGFVANYARDLFRLSVDCGSQIIPPEKWKAITQIQLPTAEEKQAAIARMQQMAAMPPIPGQPPQPPDPALQKTASSPSWEEVLKKIADDMGRTFIVNIQTSSTVDIDTAQDKSEVQEFMAAMGQLMPGLAPLVQLGDSGLEAAKGILSAVLSRFKFGQDIADLVNNIQPMPKPGETPDPAKEAEAKAAQEKMTLESQFSQAEHQMKMQKLQMETQRMQKEQEVAMAEMNYKMQEMTLRLQAAQLRAAAPKGRVPPGAQ